LRYTAPGAPKVAARAHALLKDAGFTAAIDGTRGLDHGAWAPLLYMYPDADVPVVQMSLQPELGTRHHLRLGRALRKLEEENVLVIGSGHMTHNLRDWMRGRGEPQPYAEEFSEWVRQRLENHELDALADYRSSAPHGARAHPTDEHFLPLFFALGAAREDYKAERFFSSIDSGVLSMDGYVFN
jgi:4,5-DOPA dioxygenase extradiol